MTQDPAPDGTAVVPTVRAGSNWKLPIAMIAGLATAGSIGWAALADTTGASKLLGRGDSGAGAVEEISLGSGLTMTGTTISATSSYTDEQAQDAVGAMVADSLTYVDGTPLLYLAAKDYGDFTCTGTSAVCNFDAASVAYADLANGGALSVMGRNANSSGVRADISATPASGAVLRESGSTIGFGEVLSSGIANNAVTNTDLNDMSALSVKARTVNSVGDPSDATAGAGEYGAFRERGSALSFRRESYQAVALSSGVGTFTVATSPNATIANDITAAADTLQVDFISPVNGEGGYVILTNATGAEPYDEPVFELNSSTTNVLDESTGYSQLNNAVNVFRWTFDGTRLVVWIVYSTAGSL